MLQRWIIFAAVCVPLGAQAPNSDFFESKIRPVLTAKCYPCHSAALASPAAGLRLDTKAGTQRVLVAGKPDDSRIIQAIRYTDQDLQMPPTGKLPDAVIADFEQWVKAGAVDPRTDSAGSQTPAGQTSAPLKGMSIEDGRKWWSFQPV